ncbi:hypothetical protein K7V76_003028 [Vibrio fluvialis]|uniref:hypothetical protein n=1 Tax=Vibrio sp. bablab_jr001 TaxID=2755067 RepID=UPI0018F18279|nr:hypothetical protein [Vibrio sp. bablab_jr001]EKO3517201.1 hypothetical protein [Vibrio fluvialis]EKO3523159.1 hypothetical protein [Vibrio fluvialis]EKO3528461.1 hypothetical protein [Vibrio fluvialis]ELE5890741.1 hypothetical protein [Vibrio fluvialis]ELG2962051.1 hypothetical protein [Vibrio fluvialis]
MDQLVKLAVLVVVLCVAYFAYVEYKNHTYCEALAERKEFPSNSTLPRSFFVPLGKLELTEDLKIQLKRERELIYKKCMAQ